MERPVDIALSDDSVIYRRRVCANDSPGSQTNLGATTRVIMSTASHVLMAACTSFVIYLSFQKNELFSWHPACMSLGTFFLATSIMVLSPHNYLVNKMKRQSRIRLHFILQGSVAALLLVGFLAVYINKNIRDKVHFATYHGTLGLLTLILFGLTASGGIIALYSAKLTVWVKPALIKFIHNLAGAFTFILVITTIMVGSLWIEKTYSYFAQIVYLVSIAISAILALESSLKSAHGRFKSLFSY